MLLASICWSLKPMKRKIKAYGMVSNASLICILHRTSRKRCMKWWEGHSRDSRERASVLCEGHVAHRLRAHIHLQKCSVSPAEFVYHFAHLSLALSCMKRMKLDYWSSVVFLNLPSQRKPVLCPPLRAMWRKLGGFWDMSKMKTSWDRMETPGFPTKLAPQLS